MYIPTLFREDRPEHLAEAMRAHPLATLVTLGRGGLIASHIPLLYEPLPDSPGVLRGHLARANTQWSDLQPGVEALAIFHGPQTYISPYWYATTRETGRVVPTWNYVAVHAYGTLETYDDPVRLRKHLEALTAAHEAGFTPPWTIDEAPAQFIDALLNTIVGIEIRLSRLEGKWKVSQNRSAADREGVIQALSEKSDPESAAMAQLVRERSPEK